MKLQEILKSELLPVLTELYENPYMLADVKGNIVFSNKAANEFLNLKDPDKNIFDVFSGQTSELFYSILKFRKIYEQPVLTQLNVKGKETGTVHLKYSFINAEDGEFLSFIFIRKYLQAGTGKEMELSAEKELNFPSDLLEMVKQHFPFTMVGKDLIRRKADELKEFFWVKDIEANFLLVNKAYCSYLGLSCEKIEGTGEEKYIPEYLKKMAASITEYIINTGKGVKSSGILSGSLPYGKIRIEVPLINGENKAYALVGVTVSETGKEFTGYQELLESVPSPVSVMDISGNIVYSNNEFAKIVNIERKDTKIHYNKLFSKETGLFIDAFIKSAAGDISRNFTGISFPGKRNPADYKLFLKKINLQREEHILLYLNELKSSAEMQETSNTRSKVYDILIQSNPEPVFIYEKENLRFIEVNQAALNLYGFSKNEFLQMDLTDLYAPEDIQTLLGALNGSIKEGEFSGPFRQKRKDGTFLFVEISKFPLKFGNKDAYFNVIHDVSEKLGTEKKNRLLKFVFDNTEQLVFVTDPMGFILDANNNVYSTFGYTEKNLEKTSFAALVKDEERSIITGMFKTLKKDSKKISLTIKNSKGELTPVNFIISPVIDYKNEIDAYTLLGNIQKGLKEEKTEKPELKLTPPENQPQGDNLVLMSSIFHEILTPINVILGFVQELTEGAGELTAEQKEAVDIINQNRTSLLSTMNSIVEYYNIEKKTLDLNLNDVSARELIDYLQKDFEELKRSRGIEIFTGKIISSFHFQTDKGKFSNLLFLLTKIAGYLTKEKKLYFSLYPVDDEKFAVTFKNKPDGISPSLLEELIKIFSPGGMSNTTSGLPKLSLKLAARLLNIFHAEFFVKENNTEVGFTFPAKYEGISPEFIKEEVEEDLKPLKNEIKTEPAPKTKSQVLLKDTSLKLSKYKCLCIEDQIDSQILFKVQMKDLGDIKFAASFEEALPLMDAQQFDFIVMDINLQGEYNGLDALKIIKKMPDHRNTPVIAATAYYLPGDEKNYITAGFNEFVAKPIFREKMVEALEKVLTNK